MRVDRRSGVGSKFNARSGTISLLGQVLDLCEIGSTDAASENLTFATTCLGMLLLGSYCVHWGEYRISAKQGLLQYHQNSATKDLGTLVLISYFRG